MKLLEDTLTMGIDEASAEEGLVNNSIKERFSMVGTTVEGWNSSEKRFFPNVFL